MKLDIGLNLKAKKGSDDVEIIGKNEEKELEANKLPEKQDIDKMEVNVKPEKAVIEIYDPSSPVPIRIDMNISLTWQQKLKLALLIIFVIVYIGFLIRGLIYEIKRIREVQHMIARMKPIIAALYEMDQNVAKEVQKAVNSYSLYDRPMPEEDQLYD
ncbi:uncharacterized protein LOC119832304 [Zerene cesonia]|uniref:uncharacterized protein LOC119832304 n=1 Tax=Zerene cesonia TaxID=33412 RepID=UPI0018E58125|nr:uncharacterized protein LOC119832304 [Zerene cesonia]XP_038211897.1 uncharacterized protein LOC119832304 [Zerene cesonia]